MSKQAYIKGEESLIPEKYPNDDEALITTVIKFKFLLQKIMSKWVLILVIALVGGLTGFILAYLKKPIYKAELVFALEEDKGSGGLGGAIGLASQFGFDLGGGGGGAFSGENLLKLMESKSMVEKALLSPIPHKSNKQPLIELYIEFNSLRSKWDDPELKNIKFPLSGREGFSRKQDSVMREVYKSILESNLKVIKPDKKLSIITIRVNSKSEIFSKYFAEALVEVVSDFYIQTKTKKATRNVQILQHQTDSVRRQLNSAISGTASLFDANPNPNPARQILRVPSQRRQVDVQANSTILGELVKNLEMSKVLLRKETPLIQIIDKPRFPLDIEKKMGKITTAVVGVFVGALLAVIAIFISSFLKGLRTDI